MLRDWVMAKDPWTDNDPQPGDFDAELAGIDPRYVDAHEGNPDAKLTIVVGVEGDDAKLLERLAAERGKKPGDCRTRPVGCAATTQRQMGT